MTDVSYDGGEQARTGRRPVRLGPMRRPLLLVAVALLCGVAYLAGIWSGMHTRLTCAVTNAETIVCSSRAETPAPALPPPPPHHSGSV